MRKMDFVCRFESDIVLHASSNTEGNIERFDYIAGSNFLGMAARAYDEFKEKAFDVFHSGAVRFGDAHIMHGGEATHHVPFSWFAPKGVSLEDAIKEHALYNDHFITEDEYKKFIADGEQLKQQRSGYVTAAGTMAKIEHRYAQKSSYDKRNRRSKDGYMFGYYALPKGTQWHFTVEIDDDNIDSELIRTTLLASKRLGKSRSAEYGRITIEEAAPIVPLPQQLSPIKIDGRFYIFLYAQSRLALYDEHGRESYRPSLKSLGLDGGKIAWELSQIRTDRYTPYNAARKVRDPERLVILKGSVIAVEVAEDFDVAHYQEAVSRGIGLYRSEGHGKVLVNPEFIASREPKFASGNGEKGNSKTVKGEAGAVHSWLRQQRAAQESEYEMLKAVREFIANNSVSGNKSQWGQVRSLCRSASTNEEIYDKLFDETGDGNHPKGFLLHGRAKEKWSGTLIENLRANYDENDPEGSDYLNFVRLLSIYAPKEDDKEGGE